MQKTASAEMLVFGGAKGYSFENFGFRRCKGVFLAEELFFCQNGSGFRRVRGRGFGRFWE